MEKWIRWEIKEALNESYYLDDLSWPDTGFKIKFRAESDKQKIEIFFDESIDAFRYTNESFYFKLFGDLSDKYGSGFYKDWSFFKVENSEYLEWLSTKSRGWSDEFSFTHFCILGGDEVVDIVTNYEPQITIIT